MSRREAVSVNRGFWRLSSQKSQPVPLTTHARRLAAEQMRVQHGSASFSSVWKKYAAQLVSLHKKFVRRIDWDSFAHDPKPQAPGKVLRRQTAAREKLSSYTPSFLDILFRQSGRKRAALERAVVRAAARDDSEYKDEMKAWSARIAVWERHGDLVQRVKEGDVDAWLQVLHEHSGLSRRDLFGSTVSYQVSDGKLHAVVSVQTDDIVPAFERRLIASRKYAPEKMPVENLDNLYRQHVASVALKVAGDIFRILPAEDIWLTCMTGMLRMSYGRSMPTPILSVQFNRRMFDNLNLRKLPPLDLISNFRHEKNFRPTGGFGPVKPLLPL